MDNKPRRGLGRGLDVLMSDVKKINTVEVGEKGKRDNLLPIEKLQPNENQPRRTFAAEALKDLASSISAKGIIQPLIVRPLPDEPEMYEIVAGERRWRSAQMAKLDCIPVIVREFDDSEVLQVAIIENIQRKNLSPVEEAVAYRQLVEKFGHTQEKIAESMGKSRSHVANTVRLLSLPEEVLALLDDGKITSGHARALIPCDDPAMLARKIVEKDMSVRDTENLVAKSADGKAGKDKRRKTSKTEKNPDTIDLENDLSANLGMTVILNHAEGNQNGSMTIKYGTLDQLDELCRILTFGNVNSQES